MTHLTRWRILFADLIFLCAAVNLAGMPGESYADDTPKPKRARNLEEVRAIVAGESLEQLIDNLNEGQFFFIPGYQSPQKNAEDDFEPMLSNRRTLKLIALLSQLPRDEARGRSKMICDRMYQEHTATIERVLARRRDDSLPKSTKSIVGTKLGLGAAIFALAHFAEPPTVIEEFRRLDEFAQKISKELGSGFDVMREYWLTLDGHFKISVILYSMNHCTPQDRIKQEKVAKLLDEFPRKKRVTMAGWNAEVNHYDHNHLFGEVPLDTSQGTETIEFYETDGTKGPNNKHGADNVVQELIQIWKAVE